MYTVNVRTIFVVMFGGLMTIIPLCQGAAAAAAPHGAGEEDVMTLLQYPFGTQIQAINTFEVKRSVLPHTEISLMFWTVRRPAHVPLGVIYEAETDVNHKVTVLMFPRVGKVVFFRALYFLRRITKYAADHAAAHLFAQEQQERQVEDAPNGNFIVLEHIPRTLNQVMMPESEISTLRRLKCAHQLLRAVAAMHHVNIFHLCLRPEVIGIAADGNIKIFNFACATTRENYHLREDASTENNLWYISPEMALQRDPDNEPGMVNKQDVFEVGSILFELFSGGKKLYNREQLNTLVYCVYHTSHGNAMKRSCAIYALAFYYKTFLGNNGIMDAFETAQFQRCPALEMCKEHYDTRELKRAARNAYTSELRNISHKIHHIIAPVVAATGRKEISDTGIYSLFDTMLSYAYRYRQTPREVLKDLLFKLLDQLE